MRDVVASTYCIDNEVVKPLEFLELLLRNVVHISAVCYIPETESKNRKLVVPASDRNDFDSVDAERLFIYVMDTPLWSAWIFVLCKSIGIFHTERILHVLLAIDLCCLLLKVVERSDVVQPSSMVLVVMGKQNSVKVRHTCSKHLLSEIRTRIHQNGQSFILHQHAGSQTLVAAVRTAAHLATAPDHRHTLRRSRS